MQETVNILLVDDQPGKLLSYEVILQELGENLIKASNAKEALECLLRNEVAVILMDVCMPDLDGFELMSMIREHPRFQNTAVIFISAIHLTDLDRVRGYEMGAVDYVPVPVIPEVLRAKVKVFAELFRKTRQLESLNAELESRVAERTAALEASTYRLMKSEQRRNLALAASNLGAWDWDRNSGDWHWDEGQFRIFGVDSKSFVLTADSVERLVFSEDRAKVRQAAEAIFSGAASCEVEFRVQRPDGQVRHCVGTAAATFDEKNAAVRISGVTADVTDRKEAEERQMLLAREVDHRGKNALALVQAIVKMTRANDVNSYIESVEGRIKALARVHTVLSLSRWQGADLAGLVNEELAPYQSAGSGKISTSGPTVSLQPTTAQTIALVLHELATNAAKYGALSSKGGAISLTWEIKEGGLMMRWRESGGPRASMPTRKGFGTKIIVNSVEQQLGGKVSLDWQPEGLCCTLFAPRYDRIEHNIHARITRPDGGENERMSQLEVAGNRVMIVEDEALVAMVVSEALGSLGFSVVGPFSSCAEAISSLNRDRIDAAVLDVNLGKGLAYPLADLLTELEIPFVFLTGYDSDSIERRFSKIPVLAKPVEIQSLRHVFARPDAISRRDPRSKINVR